MPSASSTVLGALLITVVVGGLWWLLPGSLAAVVTALVVVGGLFSAVIQAALGHRGRCWVQRTVRWWFGPVGTLVDPFQTG